jgi:putative ABC transport system substrate-binding protein
MNGIWIGSGSGMNLKSAIRNLKFAIIMIALLFALSFPADAQQPVKVPRIGFLSAAGPEAPAIAAFRRGLRDLGYIEGKNILIEYR